MRSDSDFRYILMHRVDSLTSVGLFTIYVSVNTRELPWLQPKVTVCWCLGDRFFWKAQHNQSIVKEGQWHFEASFFYFLLGELAGQEKKVMKIKPLMAKESGLAQEGDLEGLPSKSN